MSKRQPEPADWSSRSEALFHGSRADHDPTASDRERIRSALDRRLGQASAGLKGGEDPHALLSNGAGRWALGKFARAGIGAACVIAAGSFWLARGSESLHRAPPRPASMQAPALDAPTSERAAEPIHPVQNQAARSDHEPTSTAQSYAQLGPAPRHVPRRQRNVPHVAPVRAPAAPESSVPKLTSADPIALDHQSTVHESAPETSQTLTHHVAVTTTGARQAVVQAAPAASPTGARPRAEPADLDASNAATEELAFVTRIHTALLKSQLRSVLALCAEHERRWPHGTFVQEREGLRAIATCGARASGAGQRALAFFASYPSSPLVERVRETCAQQLMAAH